MARFTLFLVYVLLLESLTVALERTFWCTGRPIRHFKRPPVIVEVVHPYGRLAFFFCCRRKR